ncbi:sensor histidine kinase [Paenibacillus aceris]|uniref:histidine kinase n=1 Tax=Paenibacillus aceris TaxID=869555 RepID=A0ABS4I2E8_9BACL|nr:sensor histidine kinase [Paenibacillus aceris]MBP1964611.1 OmpR family two-component system bacitracin resistance sensor histidine kinase BceS [Paenibacillus aceris]NHW33602.1 HAMP domain-containing histidine kinase [Paenibacillus aceris]
MIRRYLVERRSWLLFFLSVQALLLLIAFLDHAIPFGPILYIVFLSTTIFLMFLVFRYNKETRFYKQLEERDNNLDLTSIEGADSPFESIVETSMTNLAEHLRQSASRHQVALEQEKDDLLAWIHEVKTPLTAMRLMMDRLEDETMKTALTYEWLRIHLLLDRQLHQKRLPFMENDLYIEQVNLESLTYAEIKTLKTWCIQKGIGFDADFEVTEVLSDAKWLSFILRQLVTNAVKYSDPNAADIIVRSRCCKERTVLEVIDHGRGIEPKDLPRIFDKGFTSTAWHQDSAATGMGLYLAKRAAEAMLIHLAVKSEPGSGTTFTLTFPQPNEAVRITGM